MAGIFPPMNKGGLPPGSNVCNGYSPEHKVIGEGPLYFSSECATILPDCQPNTVISELLAAVDKLGFPWNADRVDNLGTALASVLDDILRRFDAKINRSGDTMEGPLVLFRDPTVDLEAATKRYVDTLSAALNLALRAYIDQIHTEVVDDYRQRISEVDARKVNRDGDTMSGPLILARQPVLAMEAATKSYVDTEVAAGGGGGGPGGGIPEAPYDDRLYGRINQTWARIIDDGEYS